MVQCNKCDSLVESLSESITCSECRKAYHIQCTRIKNVENFNKLSSSRRSVWKCDECRPELQPSGARVTDREVGHAGSNLIMECIEKMRKEMNSQFKTVNGNISGIREEMSSFQSSIEEIKLTVDSLKQDNLSLRRECDALQEENKNLKDMAEGLKLEVAEMQQYARRDNVEIHGVPATQREDIYAVMHTIAQVIHIPFVRSDISVAHRLPRPSSGRMEHPAILVKFISRSVKTVWMEAARRCQHLTAAGLSDTWPSTPVYVNDHLTRDNKRVLSHARDLVRRKKLAFAWSKDCKVLVRGTIDGPIKHVRSIGEVDTMTH